MSKPPLLYLVHRIPYPPNKGDKVRSFNLLRHFARHYRVFLATFIDDAADEQYVDALSQWCEAVHCERLSPRAARIGSLRGLATGEALTLAYYRSKPLADWVARVVAEQGIREAAVFCSAMMQYVEAHPELSTLADYCDVDSAKWLDYADKHHGPIAWIYRREGRKLLAYERRAAGLARAVTFVSDAEAALFRKLAPECAAAVHGISNGVDADFFSADVSRASPFDSATRAVVFTGAMDYWPNIDAVTWFAQEVWPALAEFDASLRFWIVGMNPSAQVLALAQDSRIRVTGTVPDVRPYLQYGAVVVAPLRIARGIQNKVLEAMAMARPVIASPDAALGIDARDGEELLVASDAPSYVSAIRGVLADAARAARIGVAARECVVTRYSWEAHLLKLVPLMQERLA
ncbi:TIGR03087 family PEP-CTERM/XrtA system glycosyltransferase [Niveibacterium sp. 24ML]|uniref:TIGR03087 family PEP-CTERM/XrtA system glycosyltransferase n=1 Tax=Niveibacterium sp. 24ML TaxID=2985512 RepID=UPI0022718B3A|nr:TIGR03087 family PEP-CTERM/XrtA system glycosyltransferase [Niveibacterium sp. 24ML]MCX9156878.1 TIGR03087 family PEP-CTERM/XrtA system glycosyltransferase [Niveibacterium sp. 24ML]